MIDNYERILAKIAKISKLEKEEVERRIEAKRAKLSGFISKEGAAQIVAAELGISFDGEKLKIEELLPGMRKVNVVGKIINMFPVRSFTTKKGEAGKVANLVIADDTSNIKVVLWDTHHISMIERGEISPGSVVEILNGSMRDNEVHLGSFSELKTSNLVFDSIVLEKVAKEKKLSDIRISDSAIVRAFIVQAFEPRFFYVCPNCRKKAVSGVDGFICEEHGKVIPEKRALMNLVLDDGTETVRSVVFSDALQSLGLSNLESPDEVISQINSLLGKELFFLGNVRNNKFFNNMEFIIDEVKNIDLDEVITRLEKQ
jgi:replication factor A1